MRPFGHKGFTIIEVAIVLVIIGLIVGFGASLVVPLTIRAKRTETKETLKAAKESIVGFASANGRLPVWDDNTSDATVNEFCEVITNRRDAFTQPLYYFPADANNQLQTAGAICGRKTTNLTVCRDPACTSRVSSVAFVVATGSENINPQIGIVTCPAGLPAGETCIGVYDTGEPAIDNCTTAVNCPNYDAAFNRLNRAEEYDDLAEWVTLNELKVKTGCQGPPLRIVSNELPPGSATVTYSINIYADGGVTPPPYTWSLVPPVPPSWTIGPISGTLSSGTPPATGAYYVKVRVYDYNDGAPGQGPDDNFADKSFVVTINP